MSIAASDISEDPDLREALDVQNLIEKRSDYKAKLTELNMRLSRFVAQCRDIESNNRVLIAQLEAGKLGLSTAAVTLGARLQMELEETKNLILTSQSYRLELTDRLEMLELYHGQRQDELDELEKNRRRRQEEKERVEEQVKAMEEEVLKLRGHAGAGDTKPQSEEDIVKRLRREEHELRKALEQEHSASQAAWLKRERLREELHGVKRQHLVDKSEILILGIEGASDEKRRAWRSKLSAALRELHDEYTARLYKIHTEVEKAFAAKIGHGEVDSDEGLSEASGLVSQLSSINVRMEAEIKRLSARISRLKEEIAEMEIEYKDISSRKLLCESEHMAKQRELKLELMSAKEELEKSKLMVARTIREKVSLSEKLDSYRQAIDSLRQKAQSMKEESFDDCPECQRLRRIKSETTLKSNNQKTDNIIDSYYSHGGLYSAPKASFGHVVTQSCGLIMSTGQRESVLHNRANTYDQSYCCQVQPSCCYDSCDRNGYSYETRADCAKTPDRSGYRRISNQRTYRRGKTH